ncbi:MAG: UDP-2,4-diacetamido-2,4,6-trideoxy-beta-L-altropyranose hydrolase, partial [Gammaproteobacteria bacterium]|nr:UDP-2,4-diacetamido-2,4,6-trideoxy-beta-L-altropyranose hydrolase [Gammaproteobacteria bacterium]
LEILADAPPDWVVVDHYALGSEWEQIIQARGWPLLAIDDLCRPHQTQALLDQTLGRQVGNYPNPPPLTLLGTDYALLRPDFYRLREHARSRTGHALRILINLGGSDPQALTVPVLKQVLSWARRTAQHGDIQLTVVLPEQAPHFPEVARLAQDNATQVVLLGFTADMAGLLATMDLAVGAPAVSVWERCVLGVPSVLIPFADNQQDVAHALADAGAALRVSHSDLTGLDAALDQTLAQLATQRARVQQCCDGLGARRTVQHWLPPLARDGAPVRLQRMRMADSESLLAWQSAPQTRRYARNPAPPTRAEHNAWMQARLADPFCYFYRIDHADQSAGMIRLDRRQPANPSQAARYEVSILIAPSHYRLGLAQTALRLLGELHQEVDIEAVVLPANQASQHLFEQAGYQRLADDRFLRPAMAPF